MSKGPEKEGETVVPLKLDASTLTSLLGSQEGYVAQQHDRLKFSHSDEHSLNKDQVRDFFTDGYFVARGLFSTDVIEKAKSQIMEVYTRAQTIVADKKSQADERGEHLSAKFRCELECTDDQSASILSQVNDDGTVSYQADFLGWRR